MRKLIKLFGATLDQVCAAAVDRFGAQGVNDDSQKIATSIAVASAAERVTGATGDCIRALTAAVALVAAQTPALAQTVVVVEDGRASAEATAASEQSSGNMAARIAGGVVGAVIGTAVTKNAGSLGKVAAILGLGYVGQAAGDILTSNATDQHGNPIVKSKDKWGNDTYQAVARQEPVAVSWQDAHPGTESSPTRISQAVYQDAILRSSSVNMQVSQPAPYRTLDAQTHAGLYELIVQTAASRSVARSANDDLDKAELARAVAPGDPKMRANFSLANHTYAQSFRAYDTAYRQISHALVIAERNGYDVSAQRLLMGVIPVDVRREVGAPIHWPGVDARIQELDAQLHQDRMASYADISVMAQKTTSRERPRQ